MELIRSSEEAAGNPLNQEGLCILSLDGGGVRGLSTLYIIKELMDRVNSERKKDGYPSVKPCQLFDLIGGTSTGGIIAIMLGRLEMDVDDCIQSYRTIFQTIFGKKAYSPLNFRGKLKGRYDSALFEECIEIICKAHGFSGGEAFNDGKHKCKVAVAATDALITSTVLVRSYDSNKTLNNDIPFTICQAVRATSAAIAFFEPITVEPFGRRFVDGGLGANNPVEQLWNEAQNLWCHNEEIELSKILKCFVSVGTGDPGLKPISEGPWKFLSDTLVKIATETEKTAEVFVDRHYLLYERKRYFRFNVQQGLQGIALDEYKEAALIHAATVKFMDKQETRSATRECAVNLKEKQFVLEYSPKRIVDWYFTMKSALDGRNPMILLPFHRNGSLVQRDDAFITLDRLFCHSVNNPVAIWGLGGCGKTQVALEFAYRRRERQNCSIIWVHADSEPSFRKTYSDIAKLVGLSPNLKGDDLLQTVKHWMEQQSDLLLVLDNADDLRIFKTGHSDGQRDRGPELLQFVPNLRTGSVVWISRDKGILGNIVDYDRGVNVDTMTPEESLKLFEQLSGQDDIQLSQHMDELLKLLELLERLPLAIAQAAAYIRKTEVSLRQYLESFNESESRRASLLSQEFSDAYRSKVPNSVMVTWLISMRQIAEECPCGERILNTAAFWNNQGLPFELLRLAAGHEATADEVRMAAGRLIEYSFLQAQKAADGDLQNYRQHRLVNLAVRLGLSETQARQCSGDALRIMGNVFPDGNYGSWDTCEMYLPHATKVVEWESADDYPFRTPELLYRIYTFYSQQGRSNEAEHLQMKMVKILSAGLFGKDGTDEVDTMVAKAHLASVWQSQGRLKEAEGLLMIVSKSLEKKLGKDNPKTIASLTMLAQTWVKQGKLVPAERLQSQVLLTLEKVNGKNHRETLFAMSCLAANWYEQGRFDEAESLQRTGLELYQEVLGEKHLETIAIMGHLAATWSRQGRLAEAETLMLEVLQLRKDMLGGNHPATLSTMANLAATWYGQGRYKEAENQQVEVLQLLCRLLGRKHPDTISVRTSLAITLTELGRTPEAERHQLEALELQKEVLGEKHPGTILTMSSLVVTWWMLGRRQEARSLQADVVRLEVEIFGEEHCETLIAKRGLARADQELSKNEQLGVPPGADSDTPGVLSSDQSHVSSRKRLNWRNALGRKLLK